MDISAFEQFATPSEYLERYDALVASEAFEANHKEEIEFRRGSYKQFFEEILPVARLMKYRHWSGRIQNVFGNQPYDVRLEGHEDLEFLEITSAEFEDEDAFGQRTSSRGVSLAEHLP
jgi:hypothetical protein